jgi:hypothetical protein
MFVGGTWGGTLGARWHDKLETKTELHEHESERA